jgi:hypothetical protein
MAAKQIDYLEVHKHDDGSHHVVHRFKRQAVKRGGAMSGGIYPERPDEEEHGFGKGEKEQHRLMTHIAQALGFSKVAKAEAAEDRQMAGAGTGDQASDED